MSSPPPLPLPLLLALPLPSDLTSALALTFTLTFTLHQVYTDEVQDFTQAELRLFIEVRSIKPLPLGSRGP